MRRILLSLLGGIMPALALVIITCRAIDQRKSPIDEAPPVSKSPPKTKPEPERAITGKALLTQWQAASKDSRGRISFLEQLTPAQAKYLLKADPQRQQIIFDALAERDPAAAIEWADRNVELKDRPKALRALVTRWAIDDPDSCDDWLESYAAKFTEDRILKREWDSLMQFYIGIRSEQAPTERELQTSWEKLREAKTISGFRHGITYTKENQPIRFYPIVSEANRKQSWEASLKELMALPAAHPNLLWPVLHPWLAHDFDAATAWIESLPEGEQQQQIMQAVARDTNHGSHLQFDDSQKLLEWQLGVGASHASWTFNRWIDRDPTAARQWLANQPFGSEAIAPYKELVAEKLVEKDTVTALKWVNGHEDQRKREWAFRKIGRRWAEIEPWAASAWAQENLGWTEETCIERLKLDR